MTSSYGKSEETEWVDMKSRMVLARGWECGKEGDLGVRGLSVGVQATVGMNGQCVLLHWIA